MSNQTTLDDMVEEIKLDKLTPAEITKLAGGMKARDFKIRTERKKIRYVMYRIRTEIDGGPASGATNKFKETYENAEGFDGWQKFSVTWDVSLSDPQKIVSRSKSQAAEWQEVFEAKTPVILPGGEIRYPDKDVERKMKKASGK